MNLKQLHTILKSQNPNTKLDGIFSEPHCDRGYYDKVAIRKEEGESTVSDLLFLIEYDILNKTFQGYKGGDFTMDFNSEIRVGYDASCTGNDFTIELMQDVVDEDNIKILLKEYTKSI